MIAITSFMQQATTMMTTSMWKALLCLLVPFGYTATSYSSGNISNTQAYSLLPHIPRSPSLCRPTTVTAPAPLCTGLSQFSRTTVQYGPIIYEVPPEGGRNVTVVMGEANMTAEISASRVVASSARGIFTFPAPKGPLTNSVNETVIGSMIWSDRVFPSPKLAPADSKAAVDFAVKVAEEYTTFANDVTYHLGGFLMACYDFFIRADAPYPEAATALLGSEDDAFTRIIEAAKNVSAFIDDPRQVAWLGFLSQALLLDSDSSKKPGDDEIPDEYQGEENCPSPPREQYSKAAEYISTVFSGYPGIQDLCRSPPWAIENLMNVIKSLSQINSSHTDDIIKILRGLRDEYMSNHPQGADAFLGGGGTIVSGAAAFSMLSRVQMSRVTDFFSEREWYVKTERNVIDKGDWYFNSTIKWLDGAQGEVIGGGPSSTGYGYQASLSQAQGYPIMDAFSRYAHSIVSWVNIRMTEVEYTIARKSRKSLLDRSVVSRAPRRVVGNRSRSKTYLKRAESLIEAVPPSTHYQRLISASSTINKSLKDQPYSHYDTDGEGVTVFILDTGFGIDGKGNIEEIGQKSEYIYNHSSWSFTVPNKYTLPNADASRTAAEDIRDALYNDQGENVGHGTQVTILAVGRTYGIAKRADPYIVKVINSYMDDGGKHVTGLDVPQAIDVGLEHILEVIRARNLQGKAVVTCSLFFEPGGLGQPVDPLTAIFTKHLAALADLGVVWVQAAGNNGLPVERDDKVVYLGQKLPSVLGTDGNSMITVGGTYDTGRYWPFTSPEGPPGSQTPGSITLWSQAQDVACINPKGEQVAENGTDFAAPQVAGLAAYYMSLYPATFHWDNNTSGENKGLNYTSTLKSTLSTLAYRRLPMDRQLPSGVHLPFPLPTDINVAYNNFWGSQPNCLEVISGRIGDEANPESEAYQCPYPGPAKTPTISLAALTPTPAPPN